MAVVVPRYDELFDKLFDYKFSFISPIRQGPTFCWGQLQLGLNSHSIATGPEWKTFIFSPFSIIAAHFPFLQEGVWSLQSCWTANCVKSRPILMASVQKMSPKSDTSRLIYVHEYNQGPCQLYNCRLQLEPRHVQRTVKEQAVCNRMQIEVSEFWVYCAPSRQKTGRKNINGRKIRSSFTGWKGNWSLGLCESSFYCLSTLSSFLSSTQVLDWYRK